MRYLLRAANVVFAQTPTERAALVECGVAPERVVLQGLGVSAGECTGGCRQRFRARWGIGKDDVVVAHLANLSAEKGTIDLVRAALPLWQNGLSFRLALAGPAMPNFEKFWRNDQVEQRAGARLLRLGVLSDEEKRDFYAGADLFALPSRSDSFGLVLLEAWANGLANLAYRAGGIADVIRHEHDGILCDCGDVAAVAEQLGRLVSDPALRQRLGTAGRERTGRDFVWQDKLQIVQDVMRSVVRRKRGSPAPQARAACR
jgi:glycosyltransferase involved in cell wall biosynthesis